MTPQDITAIASSIIALSALVATIAQFAIQRRHNKLSVKPYLDSCNHKTGNDHDFVFSFVVENTGLGPAIIKGKRFYLDNKELDLKGRDFAEVALENILGSDYEYKLLNHKMFGINCAVKCSEETEIAKVRVLKDEKFSLDKVMKALQRIDVEFDYESFYGDKFTFTTKDK